MCIRHTRYLIYNHVTHGTVHFIPLQHSPSLLYFFAWSLLHKTQKSQTACVSRLICSRSDNSAMWIKQDPYLIAATECQHRRNLYIKHQQQFDRWPRLALSFSFFFHNKIHEKNYYFSYLKKKKIKLRNRSQTRIFSLYIHFCTGAISVEIAH